MIKKILIPFYNSIDLAESFIIRSLLIYYFHFLPGVIVSEGELAQTIIRLYGLSIKIESVPNIKFAGKEQ
jgi:hypothetical protein